MKKVLGISILFFCLTVYVQAQDVSVETLEFGTGVENRELTGVASQFPDSVEQVFCFTRITGMGDNATITHVWYFNDDEKARVELPVRSADWRTWSSKSILQSWTGEWKVEVVTPDGDLLASKTFTVTAE